MASPFFFVKKKDGKLQPIQDYQKLNNMTIKNKYPLPLITKLIDALQNAKYFTKLDIITTNFVLKPMLLNTPWVLFFPNNKIRIPLLIFPKHFQKLNEIMNLMIMNFLQL